jgi:hypothetical protein
MTWFRVEAALRDHKVLGVIAEQLRVRRAEAAGLYVLTLAGFAEHEQSGRPALVSDSDLEDWARWHGRAGRFAQLFRERFVETREGQRDPPGQIKGWWRQGALFRKQQADATKPAGNTPPPTDPQSPENPATIPRGNPAGSSGYVVVVDVDDNGTRPLTAGPARVIEPIVYTQRCTVAANRGLRENPLVAGRFNELVASNQAEPAEWLRDGVAIEVAEAAIYHRAKVFRPRGRNTQPTHLGYFRDAVKDAWEKVQGQQLEGGVNTAPPSEEVDEYELAARRLEAQEAHHVS